jgi:hypothetical protein
LISGLEVEEVGRTGVSHGPAVDPIGSWPGTTMPVVGAAVPAVPAVPVDVGTGRFAVVVTGVSQGPVVTGSSVETAVDVSTPAVEAGLVDAGAVDVGALDAEEVAVSGVVEDARPLPDASTSPECNGESSW